MLKKNCATSGSATQTLKHWVSDGYYKKLQLRLTLICVIISWGIILIFNGVIFATERFEGQRFQQMMIVEMRKPLRNFYEGGPETVGIHFQNYQDRFQTSLLVLNAFILTAVTVMSYYLVGFLLRPARQFAHEQEDFIANASHELKTPLTTVKMEMEILKEEIKESKSDVKESVEIIEDEIKTMTRLVHNLLNMSTMMAQRPIKEKVDLNNLLIEKAKKNFALAKKKKIEIKFQPLKQAIMIESDKKKLEKIIEVLLDNAQKYAKEESAVQLELVKVKNGTKIRVINEGIGVRDEDVELIFKRFYRSTEEEVSKRSGSGLGLAIAQDLAEQIGARLVLASGLPQATVFELIFESNHSIIN